MSKLTFNIDYTLVTKTSADGFVYYLSNQPYKTGPVKKVHMQKGFLNFALIDHISNGYGERLQQRYNNSFVMYFYGLMENRWKDENWEIDCIIETDRGNLNLQAESIFDRDFVQPSSITQGDRTGSQRFVLGFPIEYDLINLLASASQVKVIFPKYSFLETDSDGYSTDDKKSTNFTLAANELALAAQQFLVGINPIEVNVVEDGNATPAQAAAQGAMSEEALQLQMELQKMQMEERARLRKEVEEKQKAAAAKLKKEQEAKAAKEKKKKEELEVELVKLKKKRRNWLIPAIIFGFFTIVVLAGAQGTEGAGPVLLVLVAITIFCGLRASSNGDKAKKIEAKLKHNKAE